MVKVKPEKKEMKFRLITPYQKTMIRIRKERDKGILKNEDIDKRFNKIVLDEISSEITRVREESKEVFYRAIIAGASFGILGSFLANATFTFLRYPTTTMAIVFISCLIGFFVTIIFLIHELDKISKRQPHRTWWNKLKHRHRRFKLKIKK